ncbi:MAG TPA: maleylpyruvate isomerase family mycothiol-dependent enzyme [Acidimicrobiia bacterium]|nr:maleylpyruvate isomerase family mycothiol-dependent enzyme [Acidimicrobiia bacterium]
MTEPNADDRELVDLLARVWDDVFALCDDLTDAEWHTMTECPGWSVHDNVAHLIGIESTILGIPTPDVELGDAPHVKNDLGRMNEQWVEHYRSFAGADVLAELRTIADRRLADLRALDADGFDADAWTPVGPGKVRDLIPFRIYDTWAHEQDIRNALGRPDNLDSPVAAFCLRRAQRPLGAVVGKRVAPPEGTIVDFVVEGPNAFTHALAVTGGRAQPVDAPAAPTTRITTDTATFVRLVNGRVAPTDALASGAVTITGDTALGERVVHALNTML